MLRQKPEVSNNHIFRRYLSKTYDVTTLYMINDVYVYGINTVKINLGD